LLWAPIGANDRTLATERSIAETDVKDA